MITIPVGMLLGGVAGFIFYTLTAKPTEALAETVVKGLALAVAGIGLGTLLLKVLE